MPEPAPDRFVLAHLSDPHLTSLREIHWPELANKRILGYLSWLVRRRRIHRAEVLAALIRDLRNHAPHHIVISGDLTHLGTPRECREARAWLDELASPADVTVVPGNHDCYAPADWDATLGQWLPFLRGDGATEARSGEDLFPSLRHRGPVALIGLSTGRPTPPLFASGSVGSRQLDALDKLLANARGQFRVVVLHHGPVPGTYSARRGLDDAPALAELIARRGAELILHGHGHVRLHGTLGAPGFRVPVLGAPSASAISDAPARLAGYSLCEISTTASGWVLRVTRRALQPGADSCRTDAELHLEIPAPA